MLSEGQKGEAGYKYERYWGGIAAKRGEVVRLKVVELLGSADLFHGVGVKEEGRKDTS